MPTTASKVIPLALTAVLAAAGCAASDGGSAAPAPAASAPAPATSVAPGPTAGTDRPRAAVPPTLDFTARTIDGGSFAGSSLAGKPAVLWFWAAWCSRCRGVADEVAAVQRENAARVNVIGVAGLGSGTEAMRRFARDTGISGFPNLADDDGAVWRRFEITSQEQYVLLDSGGKVMYSGPLSQAELRQRVAGLS